LDGASGTEIWRRDIVAEKGLTAEEDQRAVGWGRAASPLIVGDWVIVPVGGPPGQTTTLAALDKQTGKTVWEAGQRQVSYASPALATLDGVPQILVVCEDWVSAHDLLTGQLLWEYAWPGKSNGNATASQPVALNGNRVFLSKGYGVGAALLHVSRHDSAAWQVEEIWRRNTVMKTKFTNVVVYNDHVYGLDDGILSCIELQTGEPKWKRGRYGHGQVLRVNKLLLVQAESGDVALVDLNPERFRELTRFRALEGKTWNNPCLYGSYLLVRNGEQAACYRLPIESQGSSVE
jgi:outer membrane protein assembly factor BamB